MLVRNNGTILGKVSLLGFSNVNLQHIEYPKNIGLMYEGEPQQISGKLFKSE